MRRGRKEQAIVVGMWCLLMVVAVYVYGLLFPGQRKEMALRVSVGADRLARTAVTQMFLKGSPLISYVFEECGTQTTQQSLVRDPSYDGYRRLGMQKSEEPEEPEAPGQEELQKAEQEEGQLAAAKNEPAEQEKTPEGQEETSAEPEETPEGKEQVQPSEQANASLEPEAVMAAAPVDRLEQFRAMAPSIGYSFEQMTDFQFLMNQLYVVSAGTSITANELVPQTLLSLPLGIEKTGEYQILIYHTHSQEAYADSVPGDASQTVVGMGDLLEECLEGYGYSVMHHKGIYDMTDGQLDRDPAYTRALPVISSILEAHPEIQVVIDLHRDGVAEDVHLVQEINGTQTARIMYFNGLCRSETGEIEGLSNPYRQENMAFSLQMALTTMARYPGLTRCIYLRSNRYNLHLRGRSALIEVGAQTNTVEEVRNAIPIVADVINQVLSNEQK